MAILKIARMGHPVLRRPAEAVADPETPEVKALVDHMIETMEDAEGMGLAAPQVYVSARLVILRTPGEEDDEDMDEHDWSGLTILANPVIEPLGDEMDEGWEGCLSVPDLRGIVPRYTRIRYTGADPRGGMIDRTVEGLHARVIQHECDHLDGILYPERMTDMTKLIFESEFRHFRGPKIEGEPEESTESTESTEDTEDTEDADAADAA